MNAEHYYFGSHSTETTPAPSGMKPCGHTHATAEEALACMPHAWEMSHNGNMAHYPLVRHVASRIVKGRAKVETPEGPKMCPCKGEYAACSSCGGTGIISAAAEAARKAALERLTVDESKATTFRESLDRVIGSSGATIETPAGERIVLAAGESLTVGSMLDESHAASTAISPSFSRSFASMYNTHAESSRETPRELTEDDVIAAYERARADVPLIEKNGRKVKPKPDAARVLDELRRAA